MYQDKNQSFYNESQVFRIDCSDNFNLSITNITQGIKDFQCHAQYWQVGSWCGGMTYELFNCQFTYNEFKNIIDSIVDKFLECKDHILTVLDKSNYFSYINLANYDSDNQSDIGINGAKYALFKMHYMLQALYHNSSNIMKILMDISNNGVTLNATQNLLKNCSSMTADPVLDPFDRISSDLQNIFFDIKGNNSGVYGTQCSFDTNDIYDLPDTNLTAYPDNMGYLPVLLGIVPIVMFVGAALIYNQHNSSCKHDEYDPNVIAEIEELTKVETVGDMHTEYHDSV